MSLSSCSFLCLLSISLVLFFSVCLSRSLTFSLSLCISTLYFFISGSLSFLSLSLLLFSLYICLFSFSLPVLYLVSVCVCKKPDTLYSIKHALCRILNENEDIITTIQPCVTLTLIRLTMFLHQVLSISLSVFLHHSHVLSVFVSIYLSICLSTSVSCFTYVFYLYQSDALTNS
jgi:hypothetical protein